MLFNSHVFLLFLAVVLLVYYPLVAKDARAGKTWLVVASLFFYGWWKWSYLALLLGSIGFNFWLARFITAARGRGGSTGTLLSVGVAANLGLIAVYKYAGFFAESLNWASNWGLPVPQIILPLAISFFTFQQIAFLVDAARGEAQTKSPLDYLLFVTFFPQLIAGPIVHHKEMLPQFGGIAATKISRNLTIGITIFILGLFKKVGIADEIAPYADLVFDAAAAGQAPTFFEAWIGALAYTFQIYFDFSGYSDMAIGLGWMFGIRLPLNFFSPYKAVNIIDFWRRWHITLSRFLRDYLYIPLGGNRLGVPRRFVNLFITMLLGGLWHGAGWTFVIWGALHGLCLILNHGWRKLLPARAAGQPATRTGRALSWCVTFLAVVVAWIFFRSADLSTALTMLAGIAGVNGVAVSAEIARALPLDTASLGLVVKEQLSLLDSSKPVWLVIGLLWVVVLAPNTMELMRRYRPALDPSRVTMGEKGWAYDWLTWRPTRLWAFLLACVGLYCLLNLARLSPFLYFQF